MLNCFLFLANRGSKARPPNKRTQDLVLKRHPTELLPVNSVFSMCWLLFMYKRICPLRLLRLKCNYFLCIFDSVHWIGSHVTLRRVYTRKTVRHSFRKLTLQSVHRGFDKLNMFTQRVVNLSFCKQKCLRECYSWDRRACTEILMHKIIVHFSVVHIETLLMRGLWVTTIENILQRSECCSHLVYIWFMKSIRHVAML